MANELLDLIVSIVKVGIKSLDLYEFNPDIGKLDESVLNRLAGKCHDLTNLSLQRFAESSDEFRHVLVSMVEKIALLDPPLTELNIFNFSENQEDGERIFSALSDSSVTKLNLIHLR